MGRPGLRGYLDASWPGTLEPPPLVAPAAPAPEEKPHAGLISQIEKAATGDELKRLWAANKDAFNDKDVVAAYQTRGQAL